MSQNMLDGAHVIVDYLIRERVPYVFGLCGHGNIQFIDALFDRSADIKTISVHHETVAGFLGGRELATDFKHPDTGLPYNPDFAAMARSAGIEGVSIDRAADLGDAVRAAIATGKPCLIDANIGADKNPAGPGCGSCQGSARASRPSAAAISTRDLRGMTIEKYRQGDR